MSGARGCPYASPELRDERLLALAAHLDLLEHFPYMTTRGPAGRPRGKGGFTLARYRYACGTPACIAGHADDLFPAPPWWDDPGPASIPDERAPREFRAGRRKLGLSRTEAIALFSPFLSYRARLVTPQEAATVIRRFVETGKIDYPAGIKATYGGETKS